MYRRVNKHVYCHINVCRDMCRDISRHTCRDMCTCMCIGMCIGMCIDTDMSMNMCIDMDNCIRMGLPPRETDLALEHPHSSGLRPCHCLVRCLLSSMSIHTSDTHVDVQFMYVYIHMLTHASRHMHTHISCTLYLACFSL